MSKTKAVTKVNAEPVGDVALQPAAPMALFGTDDPEAIVAQATKRADILAGIIRSKNLSTKIQGREFVSVEGWTLLGSLCGVFPVCVWTKPLGEDHGWEARVEARTLAGAVVGAAEAQCTRDERTWSRRDSYALRSMAATRATSKALRQPLGFIMKLAGYDPTPADEMPQEEPRRTKGRVVQSPEEEMGSAFDEAESMSAKEDWKAAIEQAQTRDDLAGIWKKVGADSRLTKDDRSELGGEMEFKAMRENWSTTEKK